VNTSVAPAEFGRGGGAIVQTSIKSGTNQIHGSAFLFRRSGYGEAHPFGTPGPISFRLGQFGGTMGAPIWKNNYLSLATTRDAVKTSPLASNLPRFQPLRCALGISASLLGTNLTSAPACAASNPAFVGKGFIFDPTTCQPFGWNGTTATNIISNPNPVGLKYLQGFPGPSTQA